MIRPLNLSMLITQHYPVVNDREIRRRSRPNPSLRRGAVLGLLAVLLPVLAILSAFCINTAHMQLTRTELMVATDAAARAGGRTLSETQSVGQAKTAARTTAAMNNVNGEPLRIRIGNGQGEIQFGTTSQPNGEHGRYQFQSVPAGQVANGQTAASAFRVVGRRDEGSLSGRVPLVIPGLLNQSNFSTTAEAVAMQVDRDIVLVVDRSGSMGFSQIVWAWNENPFDTRNRGVVNAGVDAGFLRRSGNNYFYAPGVQPYDYESWAYSEYYKKGPTPPLPWDDLQTAVDAFLEVLNSTVQNEQVALASYGSDSTFDTPLQVNYNIVKNALASKSPNGLTAIGSGMQRGMQAFSHSNARPSASKTMVVMTDGHENVSPWSADVARSIVATNNITIHTVTFTSGANQQRMKEVADIGGGSHYHAASGSELVQAFEEIANNLPTILTQ
jgi:Ca-activated chloride channel homolog